MHHSKNKMICRLENVQDLAPRMLDMLFDTAIAHVVALQGYMITNPLQLDMPKLIELHEQLQLQHFALQTLKAQSTVDVVDGIVLWTCETKGDLRIEQCSLDWLSTIIHTSMVEKKYEGPWTHGPKEDYVRLATALQDSNSPAHDHLEPT